MAIIKSGTTKIIVDEDGFLEENSVWNEEIAGILADNEGIRKLDSNKLKIINFLRQYYNKHHNFPILRNVCRKTGAHSRDCVSQEFVDPMKAWKIAGLPKPPNIFFTSFDKKKFTPNPFY
jgi:TusE/DsrC/DsvC family sulfur relay protein